MIFKEISSVDPGNRQIHTNINTLVDKIKFPNATLGGTNSYFSALHSKQAINYGIISNGLLYTIYHDFTTALFLSLSYVKLLIGNRLCDCSGKRINIINNNFQVRTSKRSFDTAAYSHCWCVMHTANT